MPKKRPLDIDSDLIMSHRFVYPGCGRGGGVGWVVGWRLLPLGDVGRDDKVMKSNSANPNPQASFSPLFCLFCLLEISRTGVVVAAIEAKGGMDRHKNPAHY